MMDLKGTWRRVLLIASAVAMVALLGVGVGASGAAPTYSINGKVTHTLVDPAKWAAAQVYAELYTRTYDDVASAWVWTSTGTTVTVAVSDGSYSIGELAPGNYRVGFGDVKGLVQPVFYPNQTTIAAATTVIIDAANVTLADQAVDAAILPSTIGGTVAFAGPDKADASISAVAYGMRYVTTGAANSVKLSPVGSSVVATDGTFKIEGLDITSTGTYIDSLGATQTITGYNEYKIEFVDANNVYGTSYSGGTSLATATTITLGVNQQLPANGSMTALPRLKMSGKVVFSGATVVPGDVYANISNSTTDAVIYSVPVAEDGTWNVHPVAADGGAFRVGFSDAEEVFGTVYYNSTGQVSTLESASVVAVITDTPAADINATMTAQVSVGIAGNDAIATAIQSSVARFADGCEGTIVLCTADGFADSLAAAPYAKAMNAPILLVHKNKLAASVLAEVGRISPNQVVIIGGPSAISFTVDQELRSAGVPVVRRLEGDDKYGTSAAVAQEMMSNGLLATGDDGKLVNIAYVATKTPYDGEVVAPVAAAQAMPILLVKKASVSQSVQDFIDDNVSLETQVLVVGSESVISADVEPNLTPVSNANEEAWAGVFTRISADKSDRYATAVAMCQYAIDNFGFSARKVALATNAGTIEALALAPVLAEKREALLLTANMLSRKSVKGSSPRSYTWLSVPTEVYLSKRRVLTDPTLPFHEVDNPYINPLDPNGDFEGKTNANVAVIDSIGQMETDVWTRALTVSQIPLPY